jgi:hypothetical protein
MTPRPHSGARRRAAHMLLPAVLLATLAAGACGARYSTAALGQYESYEPFAVVGPSSIRLELARPAHVAIIAVLAPAPGFGSAPVLFTPLYPVYETDRTHFTAGEHRLLPRRVSLIEPQVCRRTETPSLAGCRRAQHLLPGVPNPFRQAYPLDRQHYIVLVADEFIDPYAVAEELYVSVLDEQSVAELLKARDAPAAASELERVLLDRRGSPLWAGLYVTNR